MSALVDTNVLVYRFDRRHPDKQRRATVLLRRGIESESLLLCHQAIVEFVAAVTRPLAGGTALQTMAEAVRETEELCEQFTVYAERYGVPEILSEGFQQGRRYGGVRGVNPFLPA